MSETNNSETLQAEIEKAFADEISSSDAEINEVEDLTGDGGVLKKIIKDGDGFEKPLDGTEVNVRYVGTLLDGKEFDRSNEFKFVVGGNQVIKGWDITLRSMRLHEICTVTLKPEYAYGSTGAGGSIPPNATLVFEIELNSFSNEKDITKRKDGGIMKKIIVSSDEWKTPKYETEVEFKIIGRLNNGKIFQDEVKKITIGDEEVISGIELALKSMKKGEKSLFEVSPSYAFGAEGNIDLGISGDSTLSFEIELFEMKQEEPYDIDDVDEKINGGNQRKEKGNSLFREGKFRRAIKTYKRAIKFCDYLSDATEEQKKKSEEIKVMCQLNQTQCFIKLKEFKKAKDLVDKVIEKDDKNKKAYYRRGSVLAELGEWNEAIKDFERCLAIDNDNVDAKREIEKLKKKIKLQDDKDRMMYSRIFKKL